MQFLMADGVKEINVTVITISNDASDLTLKSFRCLNPECSRIVTQFTGRVSHVIEGDQPLYRPFLLFQCRICKRKYIFREL